MTKQTEEKTTKSKGGRPSKFKKKYCKEIIEHCSQEARSFASWCAKERIARSTFNKWKDEIPEFSEACDIAAQLGQEFLEKLALSSAAGTKQGQKMNAGMIQFMLKSRYPDYRPATKIESTVEQNLTASVDSRSKVETDISEEEQKRIDDEIERRLNRKLLRKERKAKKSE